MSFCMWTKASKTAKPKSRCGMTKTEARKAVENAMKRGFKFGRVGMYKAAKK